MRIGILIFRRSLHLSPWKLQTQNNGDSIIRFPELRAEVQTCGELYKKWRKERRFRRVPSGNLHFNITYIDTSVTGNGGQISADDRNNTKPVAVALHGTPGSYEDFRRLTSHLHKNGIRVIVPKLPDFTAYEPGIFRHSMEERSQLIKDFLKEINIPKVDLLICHSGSTYPSLHLCAKNDCPVIRSLALLNPSALDIMRTMKPYWLQQNIVRLCEFPLGMKLLKFFEVHVVNIVVNKFLQLENVMDPLLSATVLCYANFPQAKENIKIISAQRLPVLLAFGENDKFVEKHHSYDIAYRFGASNEDILRCDENGKLSCPSAGVEKSFLKIMAFKEGSHYVFWKNPDVVNEAVMSFLLQVIGNQR